MIPVNKVYPSFQPDQILTSENLNNLFDYLDEQERVTRTNLIGTGIVCGLKVSNNGSAILVSKGCGITTEGYLPAITDKVYTLAKDFDPVKEEYYSKFVDIQNKKKKESNGVPIQLWELLEATEPEEVLKDAVAVNTLSLNDKVVLLFVELLNDPKINCNPNSCDDKGINVNVNIRPLLISSAQVNDFLLMTGGGTGISLWHSLPELRIKRFDVKATALFEYANIIDAYRKILSSAFINSVQNNLSVAYGFIRPLVIDEYPANPFLTLANQFNFLNNGTITLTQLIQLQYYYDLFSDLIAAYNELRLKGTELAGICCPDNDFPRHLVLDKAIPDITSITSAYRHYFRPSPVLLDQQHATVEIKILFKKLALLAQKFLVPAPVPPAKGNTADTQIRITPSHLWDVAFSTKSIPYYYNLPNAAEPLLLHWSPPKTLAGRSTSNLSYHADKYAPVELDSVRNPLLYDLESYNFLRIEGHIGKPWPHVVKNILHLRNTNRLPFDVIALSADFAGVTNFLKDIAKLFAPGNTGAQATLEGLMGDTYHFSDIELMFDAVMAELSNKLGNEMRFFYDAKRDAKRPTLPTPTSFIPQVPLLKKEDPLFRFTVNTMGHEFELYYPTVKNLPFIPVAVFFQSFGQNGNNDAVDFLFKGLLYYIEKTWETITTGISKFNFMSFYFGYFTLIFVVKWIKAFNKILPEQYPLTEEENDHLDALLSISAGARVQKLYTEFLRRIMLAKLMQQLGYYTIDNPGIQHKAGVPVGGTFIVVYREEASEETPQAPITNIASAGSSKDMSKSVKEKVEFKFADSDSTDTQLRKMDEAVVASMDDTKEKVMKGVRSLFSSQAKTILKKKHSSGVAATEAAATGNTTTATAAAVANDIEDEEPVEALDSDNLSGDMLKYMAAAAAYLKQKQPNELQNIIDEVQNGLVVADFYVPYLCNSKAAPVNYIVETKEEAPKLVVTTGTPVCSEKGDTYTVSLAISGGTPPYTVDGATAPASLTIASGSGKSILVKDSTGVEASVPITPHTCPLPLQVTKGEPDCNTAGTQFLTGINISGGTAPYFVNGVQLSGSSTTITTNSAESNKVIIEDSAGKKEEVVIEAHTCAPPCNLPCNGESERCNYVLWVQRPAKSTKVGVAIKVAELVLTNENGKSFQVSLTGEIDSLISGSLIEENFDEVMKRVVAILNKNVDKEFVSDKRRFFTYDPELQVLTVERFVCHSFSLRIRGALSIDRFGTTGFDAQYINEGVKISFDGERKNSFNVTKFGCIRLNKCSNTEFAVCKEPIKIQDLKISAKLIEGARDEYELFVSDKFKIIYWYFYNTVPVYAEGQRVRAKFIDADVAVVRLLVVDDKGCFGILDEFVKLQR